MSEYKTYLSPFTWRYGSPEMRHLWSEEYKHRLWRRIWLALAEVQAEYGLVTQQQVADLQAHVEQVNLPRALEIEAEIHHDLMAELKAFAEQCTLGGGVLHLGATSTDIEDNADALRLRASLDLILRSLSQLLLIFAEKIEGWADIPILAFTHLQPAEPSTLGYRFAQYAQDLYMDYQLLRQIRGDLRGKGFKGAVGTSASYAELLGVENLSRFEARLSERLGLPFFEITTQVYPRKQDYQVLSALAGLGASLYKLAFDLRILQMPTIGEVAEPFASKQVGSSAMPFKRNPINAERMDSLARSLAQFPRLAWDNAAHSLLERTLDDSANRRTLLPEAFLIADELLRIAQRLLIGLQIDPSAMSHNLSNYAPFAATERILMALVKAGADRQEMHERLRQHAMAAWKIVRAGRPNPLAERLCNDPALLRYLNEETIRALFDSRSYFGNAPQRARAFAQKLRQVIQSSD